jgi:hypothetical protein
MGGDQVINTGINTALKKCWAESGHKTITEMLKGAPKNKPVVLPKVGLDNVCLTWALKGSCYENCCQKATHKHYGDAVHKRIYEVMDKCIVACIQG